VPDEAQCEKVKTDFGMTDDDLRKELPAFHALNVSGGVLSQSWPNTFYLFCKRWKEHRDKQAQPRIELSKAPTATKPFEPTERDWESTAKIYAQTGRWSHQFGLDPTSAACRCPPHILERLGIDPATGEIRRKAAVSS
jgi:hypothetical protein